MVPVPHSITVRRVPRAVTSLAPGLAALLLALIAGVAVWQGWRDPLAALPRGDEPALLTAEHPVALLDLNSEARTVRHYTLEHASLGPIGLVVSLPKPVPDRPLPIVLVLGGLGTGEKNIAPIRAAGDNAIIGYDWPIPRRLPKGLDLIRELPELYGRVLAVPGQVAAAINWLSTQPWADSGRISVLGFSLGALAAPAVQRLAEAAGHDVGWTVLAYGGAGVGDLIVAHPKVDAGWAEPLLAAAADMLLRPVEPAEHLPHLSGRFLVLGGSEDSMIPERSFDLMRGLTPEPKTVVLFDGEHMGMGESKRELLDEIIRISRGWLLEHGAVNRP